MSQDSGAPPAQDRPLSFSSDELLKHLDAFTKRFETSQTELASSIRNEMTAAVAPIQVSQREIIDELETTRNKVSEIALENADTKTKVEILQQQMLSMEQRLSNPNGSAPPQDSIYPALPPPTYAHPPLISHAPNIPLAGSTDHYNRVSHPELQSAPTGATAASPSAAVLVLRDAKRILGFSPIKRDDIDYLKVQNGVEDDAQAMHASILEFLTCEMKVPKSITDNLVIRRVFPPAKPSPSGWSTLYAEFQDIASAELIQQYVSNLLPGKTVSIYVPRSLHPRYSAIENMAFEYRNGEIKHKTKIRYGTNDFVLVVKPKNTNCPWSYVPLNTLPPLELSRFDGNSPSSPPPGRSRLSSKRGRSPSPESVCSKPTQKARTDESASPVTADNQTLKLSEEAPSAASSSALSRTPPKSAPPVPSSCKDPGLFQPSACASPKVSQNQDFTFSLLKSNIPMMKASLNQ